MVEIVSRVRQVACLLVLLAVSPVLATSPSCPTKGVYVQVLGAGGPELNDGLASTSYALWDNGTIRVLVDTGTGSAEHFAQTGQPFDNVEVILYSHFHTDHSADFPALIKYAFFEGRRRDLQIYGPTGNTVFPGTDDFVQRMIGKNGAFPYLSQYLTGNASYQIHPHSIPPTAQPQTFEQNGILFRSIDAEHGPLPSLAWLVQINGRSVVFSGDNGGRSDNLVRLGREANVLVAHNAVPEMTFGVARRLHMVPSRIGYIAASAQVKTVILSHFMNRTRKVKKESIATIRKNYKGSVITAQEFSCYPL